MKWRVVMRVPIVDNIVLTSDPHNFVLNREEVGKNGIKRLRPFAFYPTVCGAIEGCLETKMRESTVSSLKMLLTEHSKLVQHLRELLESDLEAKSNDDPSTVRKKIEKLKNSS
jgi:hypothetical protein